jgi:hypothetical protein
MDYDTDTDGEGDHYLHPDSYVVIADHWGIYLPQRYTKIVRPHQLTNIDNQDWSTLAAGPDAEDYWDAWDRTLANAVYCSHDGRHYTLFQDGDLWHVPVMDE